MKESDLYWEKTNIFGLIDEKMRSQLQENSGFFFFRFFFFVFVFYLFIFFFTPSLFFSLFFSLVVSVFSLFWAERPSNNLTNDLLKDPIIKSQLPFRTNSLVHVHRNKNFPGNQTIFDLKTPSYEFDQFASLHLIF